MGVCIESLSPWAQRQVFQKLTAAEAQKKAARESKYHNKTTERVTAAGNVLRFDSQKEARRYDELAALERAGKIRDLRMQVEFTLQEAYTDGEGRRVRAIRYRADFVYLKQTALLGHTREWSEGKPIWRQVVEDVKSSATRTKEYIMKRKMMKERFGIDIQEV